MKISSMALPSHCKGHSAILSRHLLTEVSYFRFVCSHCGRRESIASLELSLDYFYFEAELEVIIILKEYPRELPVDGWCNKRA
jgi:hypothetical protein